MEEFSAFAFLDIIGLLKELPFLPDDTSEEYIFDEKACGAACGLIELLRLDCDRLGLRGAVNCIDSLLDMLSFRHARMTLGVYRSECADLEKIITHEMRGTKFFYMPVNRIRYYAQRELFGTKVVKRFPAVQADMEEAGNCLAMGRNTACVFHLMRIMETAVQEFGNAVGVSLVNEKCWQNILDEVNKALKSRPQNDPNTIALSKAAAALYSVKLVWRNPVMHPKESYGEVEAQEVLQHVKVFMEHLASII